MIDTSIGWRPTYKQEQFLSVPNTIFEKFMGGGNGSGKSECLVVMPLVSKCKYSDRMWYMHPKFKGLIIRRTIPELKKELVTRSYDYYSKVGGIYNKSDRVWAFPNGGKLY